MDKEKGVVRQWAVYRRLLGYTRPYLPRLVFGSICGALSGISITGLLLNARDMLGCVFGEIKAPGAAGLASGGLSLAHLLDQARAGLGTLLGPALNDNQLQMVFAAGLFLLAALVRSLGQFLSDYHIQWVGNRVVMDIRLQTFAHLQDLSARFFSRSKTGELISRTINDSMMIERAVSVVIGDLVQQPFALLGAIWVLFALDTRLALAGMILFPICIVPIAIFGRRVRRYAKHGQERMADLLTIMQEALVGIRIVKAFGMEAYESGRFAEQCKIFFNRIMRVARDKAAIEPIIVFISMVGLLIVLGYASWSNMPAKNFITFAIAMMALYEPAKKLSKVHLNIQQTSASATRIFELLDTPPLIKDRPGAVSFQGPVESVRFENVSFAYDTHRVLRDIELNVRAGQRIALVGSSGAGKTTLVSLILRFYDVTAGRLLLNGVDLRDFTLKSLRSQIGMVTQDTFLFNDTVAANIAYGQVEAPRAAVEEAARRANAHEFIGKLAEGYNTVIGERGVRLSGGQCQRLAIARAIFRNPPILILDEATSALDTESERLVQAALDDLMEGRTVFAIAHRLSTIMHCDSIVVLEHGRIVEQGNHAALMEKNGVYRRLYDLQFSDVRGNP
jgi:subfamily B ATP-binding cassette protein MsbA